MLFVSMLLLACAPKNGETEVMASFDRSVMPDALPAPSFELPTPTWRELDNGMQVAVVENHEVPVVYVDAYFRTGTWTDGDSPGVASLTMDMLLEGAGDMDSRALSAELRRLGTRMGAGAGLDGSSVSMSTLGKNLDASLELMATVMSSPTFPKEEWSVVRSRALSDLDEQRTDPRRMAQRAFDVLMYGGAYAGNVVTKASLEDISRRDLRTWYDTHIVPVNGIFVVGGDITPDQAVDALNTHFGEWTPDGEEAPDVTPGTAFRPDETVIYVIDKPGATQSVIRAGQFVGDWTADDYYPLYVANLAMGGMFTSRVNLNLREEKGYTYGARASFRTHEGPALWIASTSVRTDATAASVREIVAEAAAVAAERPLTDDEIASARGYWLGVDPLRYENPGYLMERVQEMWRYDLDEDWLTGAPDAIRNVGPVSANSAWAERVAPDALAIVIVGDADTIRQGTTTDEGEQMPGLEDLGFTLRKLDVDGVVLDRGSKR